MERLAEVSFSVPTEAAGAVANLLVERVGAGVAQRDAETDPDIPAETVVVVAWMPPGEVDARVAEVETLLASLAEIGTRAAPFTWSAAEVPADGWIDAYKAHLRTTRIGGRFFVRPSWVERDEALPEGTVVIEMDPGQAFGTGLHESTRLLVRAMEWLARRGHAPSAVLDLGCGTGILAIVAAHLFPRADLLAVDIDPLAVEAARQNAARNGLAERIRVAEVAAQEVSGRYDLVLANLSYDAILSSRDALERAVRRGGFLGLSGLLAEQAADVAVRFTRGLAFESIFSEEEASWRGLLLRARG